MPTLVYLCPCIHLYTCTCMLLLSVWPRIFFFSYCVSIFLVPSAFFFLHLPLVYLCQVYIRIHVPVCFVYPLCWLVCVLASMYTSVYICLYTDASRFPLSSGLYFPISIFILHIFPAVFFYIFFAWLCLPALAC